MQEHDDVLLVTPEEAARRLSLGRTTIYGLMASGALPSVRIGRSRRIAVAALGEYVARVTGRRARSIDADTAAVDTSLGSSAGPQPAGNV